MDAERFDKEVWVDELADRTYDKIVAKSGAQRDELLSLGMLFAQKFLERIGGVVNIDMEMKKTEKRIGEIFKRANV